MGKLLKLLQKNLRVEIDILFNSFDLVSYWLEQYFSINELSENHVIYLRIEEILEKYYLVDERGTRNKYKQDRKHYYMEYYYQFIKNRNGKNK